MRIIGVSKDDYFGVIHTTINEDITATSIEQRPYYRTINLLIPLFKSEGFNEIITGFYLSCVPRIFKTVRISYFANEKDIQKVEPLFREYFSKNNIIETRDEINGKVYETESPVKKIVAETYGDGSKEQSFREFLVLETQIGLELLRKDLEGTRELFLNYYDKSRNIKIPSSIKEYFEPPFKKYSMTYNSLPENQKHKLFSDLEDDGWSHMMRNFILGGEKNL